MTYRTLLESTLAHALSHIESLDEAPVSATTGLADLRQRLGHQLADEGMDATQVIDQLVADVQGGVLGTSGGRFFGWDLHLSNLRPSIREGGGWPTSLCPNSQQGR
jgi:hypothetical protein